MNRPRIDASALLQPLQLAQYAGGTLLTTTAVLLVLLSTLPHGEPVLADTVSSAAYGAHTALAFAILLTFGLATGSLAVALGLRLDGPSGWACAALVGVWSVAALFGAFVKTTSTAHTGTVFSQVHTLAAVAGIAAQLLVAIAYVLVVWHRVRRIPVSLLAVTTAVVAGVVFVVIYPDSLAGLSERMAAHRVRDVDARQRSQGAAAAEPVAGEDAEVAPDALTA